VGAQHLTTIAGGGTAHSRTTITTSISTHADNTSAITQGIQLGVNGALKKNYSVLTLDLICHT